MNLKSKQLFGNAARSKPSLHRRACQSVGLATFFCLWLVPASATAAGTVRAWGNNTYGQTTVPASLSGVTAITAGGSHTVALKTDGTLVAWGYNDHGEATVPAGLSGVTALAAGSSHTLALKANGTVVAWGLNYSGQATVPPGLSGVKAVAAGGVSSVALKTDGTVVTWGNISAFDVLMPPGLSGVAAIAAGQLHVLALVSNGTVVAWGADGEGQTDVPAGLSGVTAVAAGLGHSVALKSDGTVVAWGYNNNGQTTVPVGLNGVIAIAAGAYHTLAVRTNGTVVAWGNNTYGQTTAPVGLTGVTAIAGGEYHTVALVSDAGGNTPPAITVQPASQTINVGQNVSFSVTATGSAPLNYQWRKGGANLIGATNAALTLSNVQTNQAGNYAVVITNAYGSITSSNASLTVVPQLTLAEALDTTNLTWTTGGSAGWSGQTINTHDGTDAAQSGLITDNQESWIQTTVTNGPGTLTFWWKVSSESTYDYLEFSVNGVLQSGRISGEVNWQQQTFSLAAGTQTLKWRYMKDSTASSGQDKGWVDQVSFVPIAPTPPAITVQPASQTVSVGQNVSFSVTATGSAPLSYQWRRAGTNLVGATGSTCSLGIARADQAGSYIVVVSNAAGSVTSAPPAMLTVSAASPGTVVAWGDNSNGQTNVPAGLSGVTAIAAGVDHTVVLKSAGTVGAWGGNGSGQTNVPVGLSAVAAIAAGFLHTVALKIDGTVVAWGYNSDGTQTTVPAGLSGVAALATGGGHTVVLKTNGTVVA